MSLCCIRASVKLTEMSNSSSIDQTLFIHFSFDTVFLLIQKKNLFTGRMKLKTGVLSNRYTKKKWASLDNVLNVNPLKQIPALREIYSTAQFENEQENTLYGPLEKWRSSSFQRRVLHELQAECTR